MRTVLCDYCEQPAKLVTGRDVYPHIPKLAGLRLWKCAPCEAWVGTHKNSKDHAPLGRLANEALRTMKMRAHAAFDPLWKDGHFGRKEVYALLAEKLNIEVRDCHIGMFDIKTCEKVIAIARETRSQLGGDP